MRPAPMPGELYRHFKNKMYQILAVAQHSETKEKLVIYQALYGDYGTYARPLDMFLSEVDHEKYPEAEQKYRFEKVDRSTLPPACPPAAPAEEKAVEAAAGEKTSGEAAPESIERMAETMPERKTFIPTQPRDRSKFKKRDGGYSEKKGNQKDYVPVTTPVEKGTPNPNLMAFLEADSLEEKYHILVMMRDVITDQLIDSMAASLDVMINEGDLIRRYDDLKYTIRIRMKYEDNSRLRTL